MRLKSINPATGELIREYDELQWDDVDSALNLSLEAYRHWKRSAFSRRAELLLALSDKLLEKKEGLAFSISLEMGKPIKESRSEIEKCAWVCRYYADNAESFLSPQVITTEAPQSYVAFNPLGPVLAIMPWNFPFWQVFRFAAPALLAGNTVVLKHASNVPACALAIEQVFNEAGFPVHVFQTILISSRKIDNVISDRRIQAVTFTGSTPAGRSVGELTGKFLKKSVLELGGSDPYIILADAHLETAAEICVKARLMNAGQSCISAKRFIIEAPVYDAFSELVLQKMSAAVMGDPMDETTDLGPLARNNLRLDLEAQVNNSVAKGAELLLGGVDPEIPGAFYPATVLGHVTSGMPAYHEELFGPVATLIKAANMKEAISIANDTTFGLGAAVFTSDIEKGRDIAEHELEAGSCFVNDFVKSDPRMPFGGIKESGYGRELSIFGLREFMNVKTVVVR
jgi:succinate-semialdehyde dehydrogenase / glutarate-semialdehyde dehydrogenase